MHIKNAHLHQIIKHIIVLWLLTKTFEFPHKTLHIIIMWQMNQSKGRSAVLNTLMRILVTKSRHCHFVHYQHAKLALQVCIEVTSSGIKKLNQLCFSLKINHILNQQKHMKSGDQHHQNLNNLLIMTFDEKMEHI
jgi:hypothetical protein